MKQHHQRVLRLWRCPECDRTVRLPGRVTSRTCQCMGEPTLMQLQETERFRTFDIEPFVSYQTEEDTTPTAAELVEEIPQHLMPVGPTEEEIAAKAAKPRRGKAYLRTEVDEQPKSSPPSTEDSAEETDDFGAGIDDEVSPSESLQSGRESSSSNASTTRPTESLPKADSESGGRKRKRRRRRKSGRRNSDAGQPDTSGSDRSEADDVSDAISESVKSENATAQVGDTPGTDDASDSTDGNRRGRKRRRRRRRRGSGAGAANKGSENSSGGDSASAAPSPKPE